MNYREPGEVPKYGEEEKDCGECASEKLDREQARLKRRVHKWRFLVVVASFFALSTALMCLAIKPGVGTGLTVTIWAMTTAMHSWVYRNTGR